MSRTIKGSKGPGYEYWSRRPCSICGHGPDIKAQTHAVERMQDKALVREEIKEMEEPEDEA